METVSLFVYFKNGSLELPHEISQIGQKTTKKKHFIHYVSVKKNVIAQINLFQLDGF